MDKQKRRKRSSILKNPTSSESTPTATFTRQMRRISFSSRNSVKEFRSGDDMPTIWCNSYEQLDNENINLAQNEKKEIVKNEILNTTAFDASLIDKKTERDLNNSCYNLRTSIKQNTSSYITKSNLQENDEKNCQKTTQSCLKSMPYGNKDADILNVIKPNNIITHTICNSIKSQHVRPASMMATMEKKLQEIAQIAKKNDNGSPNKIKYSDINNVNNESEEYKHNSARRTLTFKTEKQDSLADKAIKKTESQHIDISISYNQSEMLLDDSLLYDNKNNKTSVSLVRQSLERVQADLMLTTKTSNNQSTESEITDVPILTMPSVKCQETISDINDMEISGCNNLQNNTIISNDSDIDQNILNLTENIISKLNKNSHAGLNINNISFSDFEVNTKLHKYSGENFYCLEESLIIEDKLLNNKKEKVLINNCNKINRQDYTELVYDKETILTSHCSKNKESEIAQPASRQTVYTVDDMDETTTDFQLRSQADVKSGIINKEQDMIKSQGKITTSTQFRKTIFGHDAMDETLHPAQDQAFDYENENILTSHCSKNKERENAKPVSRQTVYTVDDMDETTTDFQLRSQAGVKSGIINKEQDMIKSQGKITASTQSRKTIFGHDAMDETLHPAQDQAFDYEKENIPTSHCSKNKERENAKPVSRQTIYTVDDMVETTTDFQLRSQADVKSGIINKEQDMIKSQGKITTSTQFRKTIFGHDAMDETLHPAQGQAFDYENENIPTSHCSKNKERENAKPVSRQTVYTVDDMDETTTDFQLRSQAHVKSGIINKEQDMIKSQGKITASTQSRKTIFGHDAMDETLHPAQDQAFDYEKENIPTSHCSKNKERGNAKPVSRQTVYTVDDMDETTTDFQLRSQADVKSGIINKEQDMIKSQGKITASTQSRKTIFGHDAMDETLHPAQDQAFDYEKENIPTSHCSKNKERENAKPVSRQTIYTVDDMDETTTDFQLRSQADVKSGIINKEQDMTESQGKITASTQSRKTIFGRDAMDETLHPVHDQAFEYEKENNSTNHCSKIMERENAKPASRQTVYTVDDMDETTTDFQLKSQAHDKSGIINKEQDMTKSQDKITASTQSRKTIFGHDAMDETLHPAQDQAFDYEKENIPTSHCYKNKERENAKPASRQTVYTVDDMDETTTDFQLKSQAHVKSGIINKEQDMTKSQGKITASTQSRKTIFGHDSMDETLHPVHDQALDYEKENIPINHCSKNKERENAKPASRQTVYTVDDMDETTTDFQLKSQEHDISGTINKGQDFTESQCKITASTQSRKTIFEHDAMDVTLHPVHDQALDYEKENIPTSHCYKNKERENAKPESRQTVYTVDDMDETTTDFQLKLQAHVISGTINKEQDLTKSQRKITASTQSRKTIFEHDAMDVTLHPVHDQALDYEKENIPTSHCYKNKERENAKPASRQTVYTVDDMDETTTDFQLKSQAHVKSGTINKEQDMTKSQGKITASTQSRKTNFEHDAMDVTIHAVHDQAFDYGKKNFSTSHCSKNKERENAKPASRQTVYTVDDMDETTTDFQLKSQADVKSGTINKELDMTKSQDKITASTQSRKTIIEHVAMDVTLHPAHDQAFDYENKNIPTSRCYKNNESENAKPASRQTVYTVDDMDETTTDFQLKSQADVNSGTINKEQVMTKSQGKITASTQSRKTIIGHDAMDETLHPAQDQAFDYENKNIITSRCYKNNESENAKPASRQTVYTVDDMDETTTDFQLKSQADVNSGTINKEQDMIKSQGKITASTQSRKTIIEHDAMDVTLHPVHDQAFEYANKNIPTSRCYKNKESENAKPAARQTVYTVDDMDETTTDFQLKSQEHDISGTINKEQVMTKSQGKITASTQSRKTIFGHDAMDETLHPAQDQAFDYEKENIPTSHCYKNKERENAKPASRQIVYTVDDMDETTTDFQLKSQAHDISGTINKEQDLTESQCKITASTQSRKTIFGHDAMDVTLHPVHDQAFEYEKENNSTNHCSKIMERENAKPTSSQTVYNLDDIDKTTINVGTSNKLQDLARSHCKVTSFVQLRKTAIDNDLMDVTLDQIEDNNENIYTKINNDVQKSSKIFHMEQLKLSEELELTVPKINQYSFLEECNHNNEFEASNTSDDILSDKFSSTKYYGRKSLCRQLVSVASSRESTLTNSTQFLCNLNPLELSDNNKTAEKSHFHNINISPNCSNIDDSHLKINLITPLKEECTNIESKIVDNDIIDFSNDDLLLLYLSPIKKKKKDFKLNFYTEEMTQINNGIYKLNKEIENKMDFIESLNVFNVNKVFEEIPFNNSVQYGPKIPSLKFLCQNYRDYIVHCEDKTIDDADSVLPAYFPVIPIFNKLLKNKIDQDLTDWSYNDSYYYIDLLKFTNKKIKSIVLWMHVSENKIPKDFLLFQKVFVEEDFHKKPLSARNLLKQREFLSYLPYDLTPKCKTSLEIIDFLNYINDICINVDRIVNDVITLCLENDAELIIDADENICIEKVYINTNRKSHKISFNIYKEYNFKNHINNINIKELNLGTNDKNYLNINKYAKYNGLALIENILKIVPCN